MPVVFPGVAPPAGGTTVPTDGTVVNPNWVEAFYTDHNYTGRTIIHNGLILLDFQVGQTRVCRVYVWNTALSTPAWQQAFDLDYGGMGTIGQHGTLRGFTVTRIGAEESSISAMMTTPLGTQNGQVNIRLQRGRYDVRYDVRAGSEALSSTNSVSLSTVANPKILYDSGAIRDFVLGDFLVTPSTDYGYGAYFTANSAQPFIGGFLYANQSGGTSQPYGVGASSLVQQGDTTSLAIGAQRSYGFFCIPYGVNGSYSTANLQAEAESGTLGTGWSSQANGSASAGNEAKNLSGTGSGNADTFGTAFVPAAGTYDIWFRVKVTTGTSNTSQMQLGLWNSTDSSFLGSPTTYKPNQVTTSYAWYRVSAALTPTASKSVQFRAVTTATTDDNWFIDEAVMVPLTIAADKRGPQEIWQQFAYDRSTRWVNP